MTTSGGASRLLQSALLVHEAIRHDSPNAATAFVPRLAQIIETSHAGAVLAQNVRAVLSKSPQMRRTISASTFDEMFRARGRERGVLHDAVVRTADPVELLEVGLAEYERRGNQDRLTLLAQLLDEMGRPATPALERIVVTNFVGQDAFVDLIAQVDWLDDATRTGLLLQLARSRNDSTRERLRDIGESLPTVVLKSLER